MSKGWTFTLWLESRNLAFANHRDLLIGDEPYNKYNGIREGDTKDLSYWERRELGFKQVKFTHPKGTILECDRVYIRASSKSQIKVADDYDSITWKVIVNDKAKRHSRFWAKLSDCNQIEFAPKSLSTYRDRVKLIREVVES